MDKVPPVCIEYRKNHAYIYKNSSDPPPNRGFMMTSDA